MVVRKNGILQIIDVSSALFSGYCVVSNCGFWECPNSYNQCCIETGGLNNFCFNSKMQMISPFDLASVWWAFNCSKMCSEVAKFCWFIGSWIRRFELLFHFLWLDDVFKKCSLLLQWPVNVWLLSDTGLSARLIDCINCMDVLRDVKHVI